MEQLEHFKHFGSMTINNAECTREITSRIVKAKAEFNKKKAFCTSRLDLNLRKKLS